MATVPASVIALNGIPVTNIEDVYNQVKAEARTLYNSFDSTICEVGCEKNFSNLEKTVTHYQELENLVKTGFTYTDVDGTVVTCDNYEDQDHPWETFVGKCRYFLGKYMLGKATRKCSDFYADILAEDQGHSGDCSYFAQHGDAEFFQTNTGNNSQILVKDRRPHYHNTTAFATGATIQDNSHRPLWYHVHRELNKLHAAVHATLFGTKNLTETLPPYQLFETFANTGLHYKRFDGAIVTCATYRHYGPHPWEYFDYLCRRVHRRLVRTAKMCDKFYLDNTEGQSGDCTNGVHGVRL